MPISIKSVPDISSEISKITPNLSLHEFELTLMDLIKIDKATINYVANETNAQNSSSLWFDVRKGRITASKVLDCIKKLTTKGTFLQRIIVLLEL